MAWSPERSPRLEAVPPDLAPRRAAPPASPTLFLPCRNIVPWLKKYGTDPSNGEVGGCVGVQGTLVSRLPACPVVFVYTGAAGHREKGPCPPAPFPFGKALFRCLEPGVVPYVSRPALLRPPHPLRQGRGPNAGTQRPASLCHGCVPLLGSTEGHLLSQAEDACAFGRTEGTLLGLLAHRRAVFCFGSYWPTALRGRPTILNS